MSVTLNTGTCHCPVCRGSEKLPATGTRPAAYPHELHGFQHIAKVPPSPPETPKPSPRPKVAAPIMTLQEKIDYINARTDIGVALKKMQISNLMRKLQK